MRLHGLCRAVTCPALVASTVEVAEPFVRHSARPGERNGGAVAFLRAVASNLANEPPERSPGEHRQAQARSESVGARFAARTAGYKPATAPTAAAPNTPATQPAIGSATTHACEVA
jgi:hypothetical protein